MSDYNEGFARKKPKPRKIVKPYDGTPLTDTQRARFKQRARNSALWYLGRSDKTRKELETRLNRKVDIPRDIIQEVLDDLEKIGYIDDARVAENFVRTGSEYRSLGRGGLTNELRRKGIATEVINEAVAELDPDDEEANARELIRKRMRHNRNVEPTKRVNQLVGLLARKGYSGAIAFRIVKEELANEGEDPDIDIIVFEE